MNFTAFGRGTSQPTQALKRRFDPVSPSLPKTSSLTGNGHDETNGTANGTSNDNGNGHATNGHAHPHQNGNGQAAVNGNGHLTGNGNGNGTSSAKDNANLNANGNGRRIPSLRTTLSSGVSIKGTVKFRSECEIDGEVEGTIESVGSLTVGKNGHIRGDIQTRSVTIHGTVDGNVSVGEKCELRSGCTLRGDIETNSLVVDENVNFTGNAAIATRDYLSELRPLKRDCTCNSNGNGNGNGDGENHS
ncbi:MAG TPA: polymer-forming cytoskeletal protein [Chthoniobacterales bacterium]|nr:polymer-forming cytoskeletal protein [Chthoniobacterales bacterium]